MLPWRTEIPFVALGMSFSFEFGLLVEDASTDDRRLETIGLADRPFAHLSAIGPAADAEPGGIGFALRHHRIENRHYIFVITTAPIAAIGLEEIFAVAVRAARIDHQHLIAMPCEHFAPGCLPPVTFRKIRRWPAMNAQNQR